jgi:ferritin
MPVSDAIQKAFNDQIQKEFASAYLYLSMSAYFESLSLEGFAQWMRIQAQEEAVHGMKLFDHLLERGGRVRLAAVEEPRFDFDSPLAAFEMAAAHEAVVTKSIHELFALAEGEHDYASQGILQWFSDEQVEEEATANTIVDRLKMIGDNPAALFIMDKELSGRAAVGAGGGEA